jgi:glutamine cyclotransferase
MRNVLGLLLLTIMLGGGGCDGGAQADGTSGAGATAPKGTPGAAADRVTMYGYEVVNAFPHDSAAFTQGLVFHDGALLESTGLERLSTLRRVELQSGKVLQKVDVPPYFFAEGLTLFGGKLYQLTWKGEKGFIYDPQTFQKTGEFTYEGEGWGLTHDGESLILSDGSAQLRFIDPNTFHVRRTINVNDRGRPVEELNELEYVKGEIYANVWHQNRVARVDPKSGRVVGWIDLTGLLRPGETSDPEAVLNGIAYDERGDRLFVTGKLWPKVFEVRLKQK